MVFSFYDAGPASRGTPGTEHTPNSRHRRREPGTKSRGRGRAPRPQPATTGTIRHDPPVAGGRGDPEHARAPGQAVWRLARLGRAGMAVSGSDASTTPA